MYFPGNTGSVPSLEPLIVVAVFNKDPAWLRYIRYQCD